MTRRDSTADLTSRSQSPAGSSLNELPPIVAVVIPALNEAGKISRVLAKMPRDGRFEAIVVDDGSTDGTGDEAHAHGAALIVRHDQRRGVGAAIRSGLEAGAERGRPWLAVISGDDQHEPSDLVAALDAALERGADYVQGSRWMRGGRAVEFVEGSVTDERLVSDLVSRAELVFHLAARNIVASTANPRDDFATNIGGTLNVLLAAREHGVKRVVYSSSASIYGNPRSVPINEDDGLVPLSPYAVSSLLASTTASRSTKSDALPVATVRYSNIYGPGQHPKNPYSGVVAKFLTNIYLGEPLPAHGDGSQTRDFTFVFALVVVLAAFAARVRASRAGCGCVHDPRRRRCPGNAGAHWRRPAPGLLGRGYGERAASGPASGGSSNSTRTRPWRHGRITPGRQTWMWARLGEITNGFSLMVSMRASCSAGEPV